MMTLSRRSTLKIVKGANALDVVLLLPKVFPRLAFLQIEIYVPKDEAGRRIKKAKLTSMKARVKETLHHDAKSNRRIKLPVNDFSGVLERLISKLRQSQAVGINSVCWLRDGTVRHIPMIDFKCKITRANLRRIRQSLLEIGQKGLVLQSGRSFHFYGLTLLREKEWIKFMGDSLLIKQCDSRWIGHSLLERRCNLRFTTNTLKKTNPVVRFFIGDVNVRFGKRRRSAL
jgi:hypothetical protein